MLTPFRERLNHDRSRGKCERTTENHGVFRTKPMAMAIAPKASPHNNDLKRSQPEDVATGLPDTRQRKVQPDIEQKKDDAELSQEVRGLALVDQAKRIRANQHARDKVSDDRAEPDSVHQRDRKDADRQQNDYGRKSMYFVHYSATATWKPSSKKICLLSGIVNVTYLSLIPIAP